MSSREKLLARLKGTKAGWSQEELGRLLEAYGYEGKLVNHGTLFRSPELSRHPDIEVRRQLAQVVVPRGRELKKYVGEQVEKSIEELLRFLHENGDREGSNG